MHDGSKLCYRHNPATAEKRASGDQHGGKTNKVRTLSSDTPDAPLQNAKDVQKLLAATINQVRRGEVDTKTATCIGYLLSLSLKVYEVADLEERITALEGLKEGTR